MFQHIFEIFVDLMFSKTFWYVLAWAFVSYLLYSLLAMIGHTYAY